VAVSEPSGEKASSSPTCLTKFGGLRQNEHAGWRLGAKALRLRAAGNYKGQGTIGAVALWRQAP